MLGDGLSREQDERQTDSLDFAKPNRRFAFERKNARRMPGLSNRDEDRIHDAPGLNGRGDANGCCDGAAVLTVRFFKCHSEALASARRYDESEPSHALD